MIFIYALFLAFTVFLLFLSILGAIGLWIFRKYIGHDSFPVENEDYEDYPC